ncbi:COG4315 family predicted lipoprotein [Dictyobacter formicarum]|uniref:Lipoprotein n=1 Tax=Dictyobacter formicarum TaxID=2778368 RepID=A0ABQ3VSR4_9CHLR|nr:hypothetical protein [Dictyobacter formicarum]GHO88428.1 hypothetical protein KSZ_64340 [Dictyobacter formicarum]
MFKRFLLLPLVLVFALLLASCGNSTSSNSYSTTSTGSTKATSTPTAASTTSNPVVKTTKATVNGSSQLILTDAKGMTLYYFTPDTATTSACTNSCASTWPPLFFDGTGSVPHVSSLQGTFNLLDTASKKQVSYNGHPLYTYAGDSAAGQTNGEGIGGKWFVATSTLKAQGTPQTKPANNGY